MKLSEPLRLSLRSCPKVLWGLGGCSLAFYYSVFMLSRIDESLEAEPVLDRSFTFLMSLVLTTWASAWLT